MSSLSHLPSGPRINICIHELIITDTYGLDKTNKLHMWNVHVWPTKPDLLLKYYIHNIDDIHNIDHVSETAHSKLTFSTPRWFDLAFFWDNGHKQSLS